MEETLSLQKKVKLMVDDYVEDFFATPFFRFLELRAARPAVVVGCFAAGFFVIEKATYEIETSAVIRVRRTLHRAFPFAKGSSTATRLLISFLWRTRLAGLLGFAFWTRKTSTVVVPIT